MTDGEALGLSAAITPVKCFAFCKSLLAKVSIAIIKYKRKSSLMKIPANCIVEYFPESPFSWYLFPLF